MLTWVNFNINLLNSETFQLSTNTYWYQHFLFRQKRDEIVLMMCRLLFPTSFGFGPIGPRTLVATTISSRFCLKRKCWYQYVLVLNWNVSLFNKLILKLTHVNIGFMWRCNSFLLDFILLRVSFYTAEDGISYCWGWHFILLRMTFYTAEDCISYCLGWHFILLVKRTIVKHNVRNMSLLNT
jgi:hypothetical protein